MKLRPQVVPLSPEAARLVSLGAHAPLLRAIAEVAAPVPTDMQIAKTPYHSLHALCRVRQTLLGLADEIDSVQSHAETP